jgi:phage head maturation protease
MQINTELFKKTLDICGYESDPATEERVRECFEDYVDSGCFRNLLLEECADIPTLDMCRALLNLKRPSMRNRAIPSY